MMMSSMKPITASKAVSAADELRGETQKKTDFLKMTKKKKKCVHYQFYGPTNWMKYVKETSACG